MKMLTDAQKDNLSGLLYLMSPEDIVSLANTVTNYLIVPVDYEEAVTTILQYTESVSSLMSRKKVTKELVFRYLHNNQVAGAVPALDKRAMIELLLAHWGETKQEQDKQQEQQVQKEQQVQLQGPRDEVQAMSLDFARWFYSLVNEGRFGAEHFWPDCRLLVSLQNPSLHVQENTWLDRVRNTWVMNECGVKESVIDKYERSTLRWFGHVKRMGDERIAKQERSSGAEAALLVAQLRAHFDLRFNPNLSPEGVRGASEPHGAVAVLAHGTLHQGDRCAGLFEHKFLLLRDPTMNNNWRIKRSEIFVRAPQQAIASPD